MNHTKKVEFLVSFNKHQTGTLQNIGANKNFIAQVAAITLNLKIRKLLKDAVEDRNDAIKKMKGYTRKLVQNAEFLFGMDRLGIKNIDIDALEEHISTLRTAKKTSMDIKGIALFAIASVLKNNGHTISLNINKDENNFFITISEIVFNVAGLNDGADGIKSHSQRIKLKEGQTPMGFIPALEVVPTILLGWNGKASYSIYDGCFIAKYTYEKVS